jgi:hypothetical protein
MFDPKNPLHILKLVLSLVVASLGAILVGALFGK